MRKLAIVLALTCSASAYAAPHLYGDVAATVTHCGMVIDGAPKVTAPVVPAGGITQCKFDMATVSTGSHTVTLTAIVIDPVWGNQESAPSAPFSFQRPATPATPTTLSLKP